MDELIGSTEPIYLQSDRNISSPIDYNIFMLILTKAMDVFNYYAVIVCLVFGFFGNILSMFIFINRRHLDKASAGYLGPLAFFDLWNVCVGLYYWLVQGALIATDGVFGLSSYAETDAECGMAWFFLLFPMYMSGWIIVAFSTERFLVVWFPLKMTPILTPKKRRNAILGLLAVGPLYAVTSITGPGYFPDPGDSTSTRWCPVRAGTINFFEFWFWFLCVGLGCGVPVILVLVVNILILLGVRRSGREMEGQTKNSQKNEARCLKNLLLVSTFYVIFMTPYSVFWGWSSTTGQEVGFMYARKFYSLTFYSLQWASLNYIINPILYCYSLPYYREDAAKLLSCGLIRPNDAKSVRKDTVSKSVRKI